MVYKSKTVIRKTDCINISVYLLHMETHNICHCCTMLQRLLPFQRKIERSAALPKYSSFTNTLNTNLTSQRFQEIEAIPLLMNEKN